MKHRQGLQNFTQNIKPLMLKCKGGKIITKDEQKTIVEFYLEVVHYLSQPEC